MSTLMDLYRHYDGLVKTAFSNPPANHPDPQFVEALDKACRYIVNYRSRELKLAPVRCAQLRRHILTPAQSAELLAKYSDSILKKSSKSGGDAEVEQNVLDLVSVIGYHN